jgi:hypothetical protein
MDYGRPASAPVQQAVKTELDPAQSVTAVTASDKLRNDVLSGRDPSFSRQYVIDPQTREVIFRVMDTRTRQVIRQVPDQALLRMRAYAKALAEGKTPNAADMLMDVEA